MRKRCISSSPSKREKNLPRDEVLFTSRVRLHHYLDPLQADHHHMKHVSLTYHEQK